MSYRVRVFDLSLYNGEAFYLLIRLRTLWQMVTRFFISYANCTFSGHHNRRITFAPYESQIADFAELLRPVYLDVCAGGRSWNRERTTRQQLITAVLSENARPDDLVILSDADEYIDPSVLAGLMKKPPVTCHRLTYHSDYYFLHWQFYRNWTRPMIFRFSTRSNPFVLSKYCPIYPGVAGVHCSYCFNTVKGIVQKLQIDPVFMDSKVARGISLFDDNQNATYLSQPNLPFLKLPLDMDWLSWRMPFIDLPESHLDPRTVYPRELCIPDRKTANGTLQPYQWHN
jgi:hypothetical protein